MSLIEPKIDNRNYQEILNEALARIRVHNPEWTNFEESDPGITLVQLFAFMTENLLYRSNLIPDRNRIKFLKLLGIPMHAPEPAKCIVTFSNLRGPIQAVHLSSDTGVFSGQVQFRTQDGLYVLPVEAGVYYKARPRKDIETEMKNLYEKLYSSLDEEKVKFELYETKPLIPPASGVVFPVVDLADTSSRDGDGPIKYTIDGSLWVALLARSGDEQVLRDTRTALANKVLTMGILPEMTSAARVMKPEGMPSNEEDFSLIYEIPAKDPETGSWMFTADNKKRVASYIRLESRSTSDLLSEPGIVQLTLPDSENLQLWQNLEPLEQGMGDFPPSLEDMDIQKRVITWIRIRPHQQKGSSKQQLKARISWVGINASRVTQQALAFSELIGKGTGEPDQTFVLVNKPLVPGSLNITVNAEQWKEIYDLMAADPEVPVRSPNLLSGSNIQQVSKTKVKVFTADRESGEIRFGDGLHGARPPAGALIQATYYYGGGRIGMVGIGSINKSPSLPPGFKVINPLPSWGGTEPESVKDAEKRIPGYLKHRDVLVSTADFKEITYNIPGVEMGRVEVLPLIHPDIPDVYSQGVVTIIVIPKYDPLQPDAPLPDRLFLDTVCKYLNPRRLVTTELHVIGPRYIPVWVSVGIEVIPGKDIATAIEGVKKNIREFLSPLSGGFEGAGWPGKKGVEVLELQTVVNRAPGVSKVNKIFLGGNSGAPTESIPIMELELPRLMGLAVRTGDPVEIGQLRGDLGSIGGTTDGEITKIVPVPVIPPEFQC